MTDYNSGSRNHKLSMTYADCKTREKMPSTNRNKRHQKAIFSSLNGFSLATKEYPSNSLDQ